MVNTENNKFNEVFRKRTMNLALQIIQLFQTLKKTEASKIMGRQLLRSATSVAANFRAACRARSSAEYYSKMCIVIEECDETLFWLELFESSGLVQSQLLINIKQETFKLLAVFAKTRKSMKTKT